MKRSSSIVPHRAGTSSRPTRERNLLALMMRCLDRLNDKARKAGKWVDLDAFLAAFRSALGDYNEKLSVDRSSLGCGGAPTVDYRSIMQRAVEAVRVAESRFAEAKTAQEVVTACYELTAAYARVDLIRQDAERARVIAC